MDVDKGKEGEVDDQSRMEMRTTRTVMKVALVKMNGEEN